MAFMMPVVKNDWDIYNSRTRRASEGPAKGPGGRARKVSETRSEGPESPRGAALSPHRSAPAMRSLSYCRAPPSRASLRAAREAPAGPASGGGGGCQPREDKFHSKLVEKLRRALGRPERAEERSS